jgi:Peptidase family S58
MPIFGEGPFGFGTIPRQLDAVLVRITQVKRLADGASISKIGTAPGAHDRRSARELGISVGVLPPGPLNAITDVAGVLVGQVTITRGNSINTGVTAILPHGGNVFQQKVPAAVVVGNGFGKLAGFTQVQELGELESNRNGPAVTATGDRQAISIPPRGRLCLERYEYRPSSLRR